jgi:5'-methylthioadenosine phosphorylase
MRQLAIQACKDCGITVHETGTVVVIQGPRFSSKSESKWFSSQGWEVINMTQYPEVHLAKELEMCVVNISLSTDYDSGLHGDVDPVTHSEVVKVFTQNLDKLQKMLSRLIELAPATRDQCQCATALEHARIL